jgi:hypothetical protein
MNIPAQSLVHYVREKNGTPRGVLVAVKMDSSEFGALGQGRFIGWSYCRKTDRFTKERAIDIAVGRAMAGTALDDGQMPHQLSRHLPVFIQRCKKYYKV